MNGGVRARAVVLDVSRVAAAAGFAAAPVVQTPAAVETAAFALILTTVLVPAVARWGPQRDRQQASAVLRASRTHAALSKLMSLITGTAAGPSASAAQARRRLLRPGAPAVRRRGAARARGGDAREGDADAAGDASGIEPVRLPLPSPPSPLGSTLGPDA